MHRIKKEITMVIAGLMLSIFFAVAVGAVPGLINYQGKLTDSGGAALAGDYQLTFALYDAVAAGTELWSEEQTVNVVNGIYQVTLGKFGSRLKSPGYVASITGCRNFGCAESCRKLG